MNRNQFLQLAIIAPIAGFFGVKAMAKKKEAIEWVPGGEVFHELAKANVHYITVRGEYRPDELIKAISNDYRIIDHVRNSHNDTTTYKVEWSEWKINYNMIKP